MMREYLKSNAILIALELLFVLSCFVLDRERFIYTNFLFYALLVIYFGVKKDFSLRDWLDSFKSGKQFWKEVFFTAFLLGLAFVLSTFLEGLFPHFDTKMISLKADNWLEMILFSTSTIFLPPVAEEVFYRKNLISFKNSKILFLTTMLSMFLYALEHALSLWGIALCMIWALPLSFSYIKTKNVYVVMTAHLICNVLINGFAVVQIIEFLLKQ